MVDLKKLDFENSSYFWGGPTKEQNLGFFKSLPKQQDFEYFLGF